MAETAAEAVAVLLVLGLVAAGTVTGWIIGHYTGPAGETVTVARSATQTAPSPAAKGPATAPAFSAAQLSAQPTDNWITNGGSVLNQRYSPLKEINTGNVKQLKGVWHVHLNSATGAKYSGESQPVVYGGVIYIPTGTDEVFAIDAATGKTKWHYDPHINDKITTVCCGWESRGVAIGDGKVYLGRLDGRLVALDQKTGKEVWSTAIERWQNGYTITAAPLYYDGRVYTGISGGEYEIRGRLTAVDAKTGKIAWRFYTIPGPGQFGHNTWPAKGPAWQHGGAPIWNTPSVDPKLGLLYFSTGNAAPDFAGKRRPGSNLFTASIVAIDAKTGKYRWHFQEVHHDIWDYDAPSPTVLFDVQIGGRMRHAVAEVGKTGWAYILDRATGKPLIGIVEKPVPQEKSQQTWPTQPFPVGDTTVPHSIPQSQYKLLKKDSPNIKLANGGKIFTTYSLKHPALANPGTLGGTNWPPSSFNPSTNYLYVCGVNQAALFTGGKEQPYATGQQGLGSAFVPAGKGDGTFTAVDMRTNKIAWQKGFNDICYSGSATTAGNLVFVGRNDGHLQALNAKTGKPLWSFQTGAGANNVPTIFQSNGHEYLVFYAGGSALGATPHGDDVWLFGLTGKLGPATETGKSGGVLHAGEKPNAAAGQAIFAQNCTGCHGETGHGGNGGPDLSKIPEAKNLAHVVDQVTNGGGGMPPFKNQLSPKQRQDVSAYVVEKIAQKGPTG
jgi:quinohemoprotein ethanol dehydrogenase